MEQQIDLYSPQFIANPYPTYHKMIETAPVYLEMAPWGVSRWAVFRYAEAQAVFKEASMSKELTRLVPAENLFPIDFSMLFRDPPNHTRLRSLVSQAFTPKRVKDLEPRITAIVQDLLAKMLAKDEMEFMSEFAVPLPVMVIAEMLGIPQQDRMHLHEYSKASMVPKDDETSVEGDQRIQQGYQGMVDYFNHLVKLRRADPQPDLVSAMIQARDAGDRLNDVELIGSCMLLLIAGHETTVNLLGNGLLALLTHPDQLQRLAGQADLVPSAVEEMLRYDSPVQIATFRVTTRAYELAGQQMEPNQEVAVMIGAANRDPAQFSDPDCFDVTREPNRHLAFGMGPHFCLGAPLARAEARIAFTCLLEHLPQLNMVEMPRYNAGNFMRGLRALALKRAP